MGFEKIACCYHSLTAYLIQYLLLATVILALIFNFLGFVILKWEYVSSFIHALYIISFCFNLISAASIILLIEYRCRKKINTEKNKISIKISIGNIIISILGLILSVICLVVISIKYYDHDSEIINGKKAITGVAKFFMFLDLGLNLRFFMYLFFFWISILIRLMKKTNGAYVDNKKNKDTISANSNISFAENNNITREVTVTYGNRQLNLK